MSEAKESETVEQRYFVTIEDVRQLLDEIEAKQKRVDELNEELAVDRKKLTTMVTKLGSNSATKLSSPGYLGGAGEVTMTGDSSLPSFLGGGSRLPEEASGRSCQSRCSQVVKKLESNSTTELSLPSFLGGAGEVTMTGDSSLPSFLGGGSRLPEEASGRSCQSRCSQGLGLERQSRFKSIEKIHPVMKGVSVLSINELKNYDVKAIADPTGTPSNKYKKAFKDQGNTSTKGDGDVWVEKKLVNKKTGEEVRCFVSKNTGEKVIDEPPTGASKVIFLKD